MPRLIDLTGQRFGRLTVVSRAENAKDGRVRWNCVCDCGGNAIVVTNKLKSGHTQSCGCLWFESIKKSNTTHGKTKSNLYKIWRSIKSRTGNPKQCNYHNYGARRIVICEEWKSDFQNFYNWAVRNGYKQGLTIERIDNNGNYAPDNCRWATNKEQSNNTRKNILLSYNGQAMTAAEWADILGIKRATLYQRLYSGWSTEDALTKPVRKK